MKEFLKRNLVAVVGGVAALLSAFLLLLNNFYPFDGYGVYLYLVGLVYGAIIAIAFKPKHQISKGLFVTLYALTSEVIFAFALSSIHFFDDYWPHDRNFSYGLASGIGAILLLLFTQVVLGLKVKPLIYFAIPLFTLAISFSNFWGLVLFVPMWQLAFALMLNEILKRQEQESFKAALPATE